MKLNRTRERMAMALAARPAFHVLLFITVIAISNAVFYQKPLFSFAVANLDHFSFNGAQTLATLFVLVASVTAVFLSLISLLSRRVLKVVCMLGAFCNSLALYFVETYGVVLDREMMGNVFNTDVAEASSFLHPMLLVYLVVFGLLPCWIVGRIKIEQAPIYQRLVYLVVVSLLGTGWIYANSRTWLWIDKNASRLGGMIMPWSYVANLSRYYGNHLMASREQTLLPTATPTSREKTVVFLVIGESARAQNFSLYGYQRPTNPLLAEAGVVALPRTSACATYTTAALLCILSHTTPRQKFYASHEPLPSYLQRHGIDVIWRTNNWGEPPIKVGTFERAKDLQHQCQGPSCKFDEVMLQDLDQRIRSSTQEKVFVVLHQGGSHGPSYHSKYPKQFERFTPVCKSVELNQCTNEELVNAYDNTILYTDHLLYRAIGLLKAIPNTATALMYISDHGESLGEYGLYLHGAPYSVAPEVQKNIPFLVWMSDSFKRTKGIAPSHLVQDARHSQENVFHSVMGALGMQSEIYASRLDIFSDQNK